MSEWEDIGTLLLKYGLIDNNDLKEGLKIQKESGLRLGESLVKLGKVTMEDIDWVLSKQLDIPFVIIDDININTDMLEQFEKEFLIENRILPLYETGDQISIVIEDPFNKSAISFIEESFGKKVSLSTGSGRKIEDLLKLTFNKAGLPALIDSIKTTIEKIKETSFYRIDFLLSERSCRINVFGSGILKQLLKVKGHYTVEDIFSAFDDINVHFLYEMFSSNGRRFVAVYPLTNKIDILRLPAIVGRYGLVLPEDTMFSDVYVSRLHYVFPLERPLPGYPFLATRSSHSPYEKNIYTIDAAPAEFNNFYINAYIPSKCRSCKGAGCSACNNLGHEFHKLEGIYSSRDLKEKLKEV